MRQFARVRRADTFPGHCLRCPRIDDLIDLGAEEIPGYGTVLLCFNCFSELATGLDLVTGDQHKATIAALQEQIRKLEVELVLTTDPRSTPHGSLRTDSGDADGVRNPGPGGLADPHVEPAHERERELIAELDRGAADGAAGDVRVDTDGGPDGDADADADADGIDPALSAGAELEGDQWDILNAR